MNFLKVFWCQKRMESKIQVRLIRTKYQKHVACSCGYKLVCFDDQFSKPFKS